VKRNELFRTVSTRAPPQPDIVDDRPSVFVPDALNPKLITPPVVRTCGDCTMCCKIMKVDDVELQKPANKWCDHCTKSGCAIYESRPQSCRNFNCLWLSGAGDESIRPDKSKVVMGANRDGKIVFYVDPSRPDAWRKPFFQKILNGLTRAYVVIGERRIVISGTKEDHEDARRRVEVATKGSK
jgi:uncharacterized protein